jgi:hypothetical protein
MTQSFGGALEFERRKKYENTFVDLTNYYFFLGW